MAESRQCLHCGAQVHPTDDTCVSCGQSLAAHQPAPPPPQQQAIWAIWALVLGILSLVFCPPTAPFAIWTGVTSRRVGENNGMATAGIVLGIIGCLGLLLWMLYILVVIGFIGAAVIPSLS